MADAAGAALIRDPKAIVLGWVVMGTFAMAILALPCLLVARHVG